MDRANTKVLGRYKGELYQDAVRRGLIAGKDFGLERNVDEKDSEVGAAMHEVYSTEVVRTIRNMKV